jgi:signal transduction histidine kinase
MEKHKILLVDDEKNILKALRRTLFREPCELFTASGGSEGLRVMEMHPIDLVISDQMMPRMTGVAFLQQVRERWPDTIRIMLTGQSSIDAAVSAINDGEVYRFLTKPIENEDFRMTIRSALRHRDLIQENRQLLERIERQNTQLMEWNEHLEERVRERTDALSKSEEKRREMELELLQQAKLADIGMLASGIAHNLKNPLTVLSGRLQLIQRINPDIEKEKVDIMLRQVDAMNSIIENMMHKSRQEQEQDEQLLDLNTLLRDELTFFEANLEFKHKIKKEYHFAENLPAIRGVYSDFSQSLMNMVKNAMDAMHDSKEKKLTVRTDVEDGFIRIVLSDTGCGIPQAHIPKLFSPFFTTKPVSGKQQGDEPTGTGLGLSSAYQLLSPYGAKIAVESEEGGGTTFTVRIPVKRET